MSQGIDMNDSNLSENPSEKSTTMSDLGIPRVKEGTPERERLPDRRLDAKNLISKIRVMLLAKPKAIEKGVISEDLDELYELFVQQSMALAQAYKEIDQYTLLVAKDDYTTFAEVTRTSVPEEQKRDKSKPTPEKKGKTRTPIPVTDHVLLIYPKDKKEKSRSVDKRLTQAISPRDLRIEVKGKKPVSSGGLCVRLSKKEEVEILERAIKENEALKDTVQCTVPKLRNPRFIVYDVPNDINGSDVIEAAAAQAGVECDEIKVKFPLKGKDYTNWVLESTPSAFRPIKSLSKVVIGWNRSKITEYIRPTQCFKCGRYGHIGKNCVNRDICLECGNSKKKKKACSEGKCTRHCSNCEHVNQFYPEQQRVNTDHSSLDPRCPTRALEIAKLRKRTNYG